MSDLPSEITPGDIKYILDNPWYISEGEWSLGDNQEIPSTTINKRLQLGKIDGYSKIWKTTKNEPIAILGGYLVADKMYETFFIASKHMEEHALKLSFDMRKILEEKAQVYRGCTLRLYSSSTHPKQMTWFRFLGFKHKKENDISNFKYFEYASRV